MAQVDNDDDDDDDEDNEVSLEQIVALHNDLCRFE